MSSHAPMLSLDSPSPWNRTRPRGVCITLPGVDMAVLPRAVEKVLVSPAPLRGQGCAVCWVSTANGEGTEPGNPTQPRPTHLKESDVGWTPHPPPSHPPLSPRPPPPAHSAPYNSGSGAAVLRSRDTTAPPTLRLPPTALASPSYEHTGRRTQGGGQGRVKCDSDVCVGMWGGRG